MAFVGEWYIMVVSPGTPEGLLSIDLARSQPKSTSTKVDSRCDILRCQAAIQGPRMLLGFVSANTSPDAGGKILGSCLNHSPAIWYFPGNDANNNIQRHRNALPADL
jgi:hypothetical protein